MPALSSRNKYSLGLHLHLFTFCVCFKQKRYKRAAELGHSGGQAQLGLLYMNGTGVQQDYALAAKWLLQSAMTVSPPRKFTKAKQEAHLEAAPSPTTTPPSQGNESAQFNLGLCYANGTGVDKNSRLAAEWYEKAASKGFAAAQHNLGVMLENGNGVAKNPSLAVSWYTKAADQGHSLSQFNLGACYHSGVGKNSCALAR